jgi:hypothetical protein
MVNANNKQKYTNKIGQNTGISKISKKLQKSEIRVALIAEYL